MSATRPTWPKNVLRQRPCSESRSRKNVQNVKREKKQKSLREQGWKRRPRNLWNKNNARRFWHIV